jgi:hypothetical protein
MPERSQSWPWPRCEGHEPASIRFDTFAMSSKLTSELVLRTHERSASPTRHNFP